MDPAPHRPGRVPVDAAPSTAHPPQGRAETECAAAPGPARALAGEAPTRPLPQSGRVLKALDRDGLFALYQEARRLRLGLGSGSPWLYAHPDPDATHYLFPDPAPYYWPDPEKGRHWWQCHVLVRMSDGEQVSSSLAVLPETFTALPATVSRRRQRRLVLTTRLTERDTYLWGRDHDAVCAPERCGYTPPDGPPDPESGS